MKTRTRWWAVLALAGSVSGQALGQEQATYGPPSLAPPSAEGPGSDQPAGLPPPEPYVRDAGPVSADIGARPPATSAGPRVAVARSIIDAAGAFDGYMRRASAIKASFSNGVSVARAVSLGSVYEPGQLEEGEIAYAALVALQDPAFVQAVRDVGQNPRSREAFAAGLINQPETVLAAAAARKAATRVSAVLGRMGAQLVVAGAAVKQSAYDVQAEDWSRQAIVGPEERLSRIKAQSAVAVSLLPSDTAHLIGGVTSLRDADTDAGAGAGLPSEATTASPVVTRGMALAALAILGKAGDDQAQNVAILMTDPKNAECIKRARLDLFQCLAVAGPHYENLFCLGRHGMMDTGQCVVAAAGVDDESLRPLVDQRSVFVPIAVASAAAEGPGPEREGVFGPPSRPAGGVSAPMAADTPVNYSPYTGPQ